MPFPKEMKLSIIQVIKSPILLMPILRFLVSYPHSLHTYTLFLRNPFILVELNDVIGSAYTLRFTFLLPQYLHFLLMFIPPWKKKNYSTGTLAMFIY